MNNNKNTQRWCFVTIFYSVSEVSSVGSFVIGISWKIVDSSSSVAPPSLQLASFSFVTITVEGWGRVG